jgi:pyruvate, water dikinase
LFFSLTHRKTASLGELIQELTPLGVSTPGGFAVSSTAYDAVLNQDNLRERLQQVLEGVDGTYLYFLSLCKTSNQNEKRTATIFTQGF